MPRNREPSKLDDLVEASFAPRPRALCWALTLEGEAAEYIRALEAAAASGRTPATSAIQRILAEEFDVHRGDTAIRRHFRGTCSCPR